MTEPSTPDDAEDWQLFDCLSRTGAGMETFVHLVETKANPNVTDAAGISLLTRAVYSQHYPYVQLLLEAKADPNFVYDARKYVAYQRATLARANALSPMASPVSTIDILNKQPKTTTSTPIATSLEDQDEDEDSENSNHLQVELATMTTTTTTTTGGEESDNETPELQMSPSHLLDSRNGNKKDLTRVIEPIPALLPDAIQPLPFLAASLHTRRVFDYLMRALTFQEVLQLRITSIQEPPPEAIFDDSIPLDKQFGSSDGISLLEFAALSCPDPMVLDYLLRYFTRNQAKFTPETIPYLRPSVPACYWPVRVDGGDISNKPGLSVVKYIANYFMSHAVQNGMVEFVTLLLEFNADPNGVIRDWSDIDNSNTTFSEFLFEPYIIVAAGEGYDDIVRTLIAYNADINASSNIPQSHHDGAFLNVLSMAFFQGHLRLCSHLLTYGAPPTDAENVDDDAKANQLELRGPTDDLHQPIDSSQLDTLLSQKIKVYIDPVNISRLESFVSYRYEQYMSEIKTSRRKHIGGDEQSSSSSSSSNTHGNGANKGIRRLFRSIVDTAKIAVHDVKPSSYRPSVVNHPSSTSQHDGSQDASYIVDGLKNSDQKTSRGSVTPTSGPLPTPSRPSSRPSTLNTTGPSNLIISPRGGQQTPSSSQTPASPSKSQQHRGSAILPPQQTPQSDSHIPLGRQLAPSMLRLLQGPLPMPYHITSLTRMLLQKPTTQTLQNTSRNVEFCRRLYLEPLIIYYCHLNDHNMIHALLKLSLYRRKYLIELQKTQNQEEKEQLLESRLKSHNIPENELGQIEGGIDEETLETADIQEHPDEENEIHRDRDRSSSGHLIHSSSTASTRSVGSRRGGRHNSAVDTNSSAASNSANPDWSPLTNPHLIDARNPYNQFRPIHYAISHLDLELVKSLLPYHPNLLMAESGPASTAVHSPLAFALQLQAKFRLALEKEMQLQWNFYLDCHPPSVLSKLYEYIPHFAQQTGPMHALQARLSSKKDHNHFDDDDEDDDDDNQFNGDLEDVLISVNWDIIDGEQPISSTSDPVSAPAAAPSPTAASIPAKTFKASQSQHISSKPAPSVISASAPSTSAYLPKNISQRPVVTTEPSQVQPQQPPAPAPAATASKSITIVSSPSSSLSTATPSSSIAPQIAPKRPRRSVPNPVAPGSTSAAPAPAPAPAPVPARTVTVVPLSPTSTTDPPPPPPDDDDDVAPPPPPPAEFDSISPTSAATSPAVSTPASPTAPPVPPRRQNRGLLAKAKLQASEQPPLPPPAPLPDFYTTSSAFAPIPIAVTSGNHQPFTNLELTNQFVIEPDRPRLEIDLSVFMEFIVRTYARQGKIAAQIDLLFPSYQASPNRNNNNNNNNDSNNNNNNNWKKASPRSFASSPSFSGSQQPNKWHEDNVANALRHIASQSVFCMDVTKNMHLPEYLSLLSYIPPNMTLSVQQSKQLRCINSFLTVSPELEKQLCRLARITEIIDILAYFTTRLQQQKQDKYSQLVKERSPALKSFDFHSITDVEFPSLVEYSRFRHGIAKRRREQEKMLQHEADREAAKAAKAAAAAAALAASATVSPLHHDLSNVSNQSSASSHTAASKQDAPSPSSSPLMNHCSSAPALTSIGLGATLSPALNNSSGLEFPRQDSMLHIFKRRAAPTNNDQLATAFEDSTLKVDNEMSSLYASRPHDDSSDEGEGENDNTQLHHVEMPQRSAQLSRRNSFFDRLVTVSSVSLNTSSSASSRHDEVDETLRNATNLYDYAAAEEQAASRDMAVAMLLDGSSSARRAREDEDGIEQDATGQTNNSATGEDGRESQSKNSLVSDDSRLLRSSDLSAHGGKRSRRTNITLAKLLAQDPTAPTSDSTSDTSQLRQNAYSDLQTQGDAPYVYTFAEKHRLMLIQLMNEKLNTEDKKMYDLFQQQAIAYQSIVPRPYPRNTPLQIALATFSPKKQKTIDFTQLNISLRELNEPPQLFQARVLNPDARVTLSTSKRHGGNVVSIIRDQPPLKHIVWADIVAATEHVDTAGITNGDNNSKQSE